MPDNKAGKGKCLIIGVGPGVGGGPGESGDRVLGINIKRGGAGSGIERRHRTRGGEGAGGTEQRIEVVAVSLSEPRSGARDRVSVGGSVQPRKIHLRGCREMPWTGHDKGFVVLTVELTETRNRGPV